MRQQKTDRGAVATLKTYFNRMDFADRDSDLDMDMLTNAAWEGATFSNGANGTINLNAVFGVPVNARAVFVWASARDAASAGGTYYFNVRTKATTANPHFTCRCPQGVDDELGQQHGFVPIPAAGTLYYNVVASGVNTMDVWLRIIGWVR